MVEIDLTKAMGLRLRLVVRVEGHFRRSVEIDLTKAMGLRLRVGPDDFDGDINARGNRPH